MAAVSGLTRAWVVDHGSFPNEPVQITGKISIMKSGVLLVREGDKITCFSPNQWFVTDNGEAEPSRQE